MIKTLAFAIVGLPTALALSASAASAQSITCHALRTSHSSLEGTCVQGDTVIGQVTFRRAAGNSPFLWSGTIRGSHFRSAVSSGPGGETELQLDTRSGGSLGLGRAWLKVTVVRAEANALTFSFSFDQPAPPTYADIDILHRARTYLSDSSRWFKADSTDMEAAPVKGFSCFAAVRQSMFCAVYLASLDVVGVYAHFRPAINAVRSAVSAQSNRGYRHPLVDFNNDPATSLAGVQAVLDEALAALRTEQQRSAPSGPPVDPDGFFLAHRQRQALAARSPSRSLQWQFLGPATMDGRANDVAVVNTPAGPKIYAAYAFGGLWVADTTGRPARPLFTSAPEMTIHAMAVAPSRSTELWVGTGSGLYKSRDEGKSWRFVGLAGTRTIWRIAVDPQDPQRVFVAAHGPEFAASTNRGLFRTTDGGRTWRQVLYTGPHTGAADVVFDPSSSTTVYATTYQKRFTAGGRPVSTDSAERGAGSIWKSTDGGDTWHELDAGLPVAGLRGRIGLAVSRSQPQTLYALVDSYEPSRPTRPGELTFVNHPVLTVFTGRVLYRSTNGGVTWERRGRPGDDYDETLSLVAINDDFGQVEVDPRDPNTVYTLAPLLRVSRDGGVTFKDIEVGADQRRLWIDKDYPRILYSANDRGVYWSRDRGDTWHPIRAPNVAIHEVAVDMARPFRVYASVQDGWSIRTTVDVGPGRRKVASRDFERAMGGEQATFVFPGGDPLLVVTNYHNVLPRIARFDVTDTSDAGRTMIQPPSVPGEPPIRWALSIPILASVHDSQTLYVAFQHLVKSTDLGRTWRRISGDLTDNEPTMPFQPRHAFQAISALAESPHERGTLYAGTDDGHLWLTRDDGATWIELTGSLPTRTQVSSILVSRRDPATVYVTQAARNAPEWFEPDATPALVFKSTDYGRTFRRIAATLPAGAAYVIREDPRDARVLYLGATSGAFVSTDAGNSWHVLGTGLPTVPVRDIAVHPRDHILIAGTWGRSIWALDVERIGPIR